MAAVQRAAVELLAEHGPREVTVRRVADLAGVNHALIHRHYGTKDALVRAVVTEQSQALARTAAALPRTDAAGLLRLLEEHGAYWRILARIVLDDPAVLGGGELPAATATLALVTGGDAADHETRTAAATAASTALGWLVFGPHLATVLGVEDAELFRDRVGDSVRRTIGRGRSAPRNVVR